MDYKKYKALIFDCDGTLVDSMPAHYLAWEATMNKYDIGFSEERFYALAGVNPENVVKILADESGISLDAYAVAMEKEDCYQNEYFDRVTAIDRVVKIAETYKDYGPMAVGSGSGREIVEKSLAKIGILDWFDVLVCSEDVLNPKPAADVFLQGAKVLEVSPSDCCVFEDADLGVKAAETAGMDVVDIRTWE